VSRKNPKVVDELRENLGEWTEADLVAYVRRQKSAFREIRAPATDFLGWMMLKLSLPRAKAKQVLDWVEQQK
jgi:hypothetical protein